MHDGRTRLAASAALWGLICWLPGCGAGDGAGIQSVSDEPGVDRPDLSASGDPCAADADCDSLDDGDRCNGWFACDAGECIAVAAPPCEDPAGADGCRVSTCDPSTGACTTSTEADGTPCDDLDGCTFGDVCAAGECLPGSAVACPDDGPCLAATCHPEDGCVDAPKPDGTACSDGDACTDGDECVAGVCAAGEQVCLCEDDGECEAFQLDPCGEALLCVDKRCKPAGVPAIDCPESEDPCLVSVCDPVAAECVTKAAPPATPCGGGEGCAAEAVCQLGECHLPDELCDDDNECTWDRCELSGCEHDMLVGPCDDGDPCTDGDHCETGSCVAGPGSCQCADDSDCTGEGFDPCVGVWTCQEGSCALVPDSAPDCSPTDTDPCVVGACEAGECSEVAQGDGAACDDGAPCTLDTVCTGGVCQGGVPNDCDDGDPCTNDSCVPGLGCKHTFNSLPCDDGNACTKSDTCIGGQCFGGSAVQCEAAGPCMSSSCEPDAGCVEAPADEGAPCDDGSVCTVGDVCAAGACVGESVCDCVVDSDCADDGDLCNGVPACVDGSCVVAPSSLVTCDAPENACKVATCDPATGSCVTTNAEDGATCDAGPCSQPGTCAGGSCQAEPVACPSTTPCSVGTCDPTTGLCGFADVDGAACDDGDPCTLGDVCSGGACGGPDKLICDDANACTTDSCQSGTGCVFTLKTCDDELACTSDTCDPLSGCLHQPVACPATAGEACMVSVCSEPAGSCVSEPMDAGTDCSDGDLCTLEDGCDGTGECLGLPKGCDDGEACTADSCAGGACVHTPGPGCETSPCDGKPAGGACDDLDASTTMDICVSGVCRGFVKQTWEGDGFLGHVVMYRVAHTDSGWVASASATGGQVGTSAALVPLPLSDLTEAIPETVGSTVFVGLQSGWAASDDGRLWRLSDFGAAGWYWDDSSGVGFDIGTTGGGVPSSLYASAAPSASGAKTLLVAGTTWQGAPWLVRCVEGPAQAWSFCAPESVEGGANGGAFMAVAGAPCDDPDGGQCSDFPAALGVDFWSGAYDLSGNPTYVNYAYDRANGGYWPLGFVDGGASLSRTLDAAWLGGGRFALVGSAGYVRLKPDGAPWQNALGFEADAWASIHTGAWAGAGVFIAVGYKDTAAGRKPMLRTLDLAKQDVTDTASWTTVFGGEVLDGLEAGLWDIHGTADGEIILVGNALGGDGYYDAVMYKREP